MLLFFWTKDVKILLFQVEYYLLVLSKWIITILFIYQNINTFITIVFIKSYFSSKSKIQWFDHFISQAIHIRYIRHSGHSWRSKTKLISKVLLWTPTHGYIRISQTAKICILQFCKHWIQSKGMITNRYGFQERIKWISAVSMFDVEADDY